MSAAVRLADGAVFSRVNKALPQLLAQGHAPGVTSHDLRHVALVVRILELEMQSKSELSLTNVMNLIISDRFLDAPPAYDAAGAPAVRTPDSRSACAPADTLCTYAESVSLPWAMAKIRHLYRSRTLLRYLRTVVETDALPRLGVAAFRGHPLFAATFRAAGPADPIDAALQDYMGLYRESLIEDFERARAPADDAWSRAAYAMLLASRAGLRVKDVLKRLRIKAIADVEDSAHLDEFVRDVSRLPPAPPSQKSEGGSYLDDAPQPFSRHTPERITHVGLYSLKSPSSEIRPFAP